MSPLQSQIHLQRTQQQQKQEYSKNHVSWLFTHLTSHGSFFSASFTLDAVGDGETLLQWFSRLNFSRYIAFETIL
jgi:hypothetical protein